MRSSAPVCSIPASVHSPFRPYVCPCGPVNTQLPPSVAPAHVPNNQQLCFAPPPAFALASFSDSDESDSPVPSIGSRGSDYVHVRGSSSQETSPAGAVNVSMLTVRRNNPYIISTLTPTNGARTPAMVGIAHQPLVSKCDYVTWPARIEEVLSSAPPADFSHLPVVYVDQVKFELTAGQLRWLIRNMSGVLARRVTSVKPGTFAVILATVEDATTVKLLTRMVLFDHHGAWVPRTEEQFRSMERYMSTREFHMRGQRLPREAMTIQDVPRRGSRGPSATAV